MRVTLTLDTDVALGLKRLREKEHGKSFKEVVNEVLKAGLETDSREREVEKPFVVEPFDLRDGLSYDNIEELDTQP